MRSEPENKYYIAQQCYQNKTQYTKNKYTKERVTEMRLKTFTTRNNKAQSKEITSLLQPPHTLHCIPLRKGNYFFHGSPVMDEFDC